MAGRVFLSIEDREGNEVRFEQYDTDGVMSETIETQIDRLLKIVYAKARKVYPEKEEND